VPIRIGGGTRLKIYEAMAMGKPVISTTVGAEGLPIKNNTEILLADTPTSFAEAILRVLKGERLAKELGTNARQLVSENFGWEKVSASFARICEHTIMRFSVPSDYADFKEGVQPIN
jgi:glycosyltransferase involved in cell wall biosynthesis